MIVTRNERIKKVLLDLSHTGYTEELVKFEARSLIKELDEEVCTYKAKLNMVKDLVMNSDKYDDSDFEGCVFQNDILDIIGGDINDR